MATVFLERTEDIDRCAHCGGRCCKLAPGHFVPDDFGQWGGVTVDVVVKLLATGVASMDCGLVGTPNSRLAPILMPAARGLNQPEIDFFHCSVRCAHLQNKGCAFPLNERPYECAVIVPNDRDCALPDDLHMEFFWLSCQTVLREAVERISSSPWLDELCRQLADPKRSDLKIQGARRLVAKWGLADSTLEIDYIAETARAIPSSLHLT